MYTSAYMRSQHSEKSEVSGKRAGLREAVRSRSVFRTLTNSVTPASNTSMLWWAGNSADSDTGSRHFLLGSKEDGVGLASDTAAAAPTLVIDYTAVPEPGATVLLAAGLLTLSARRRKAS